jgi:hypothetical protein
MALRSVVKEDRASPVVWTAVLGNKLDVQLVGWVTMKVGGLVATSVEVWVVAPEAAALTKLMYAV